LLWEDRKIKYSKLLFRDIKLSLECKFCILCVVNSDAEIRGIVSDGDIRRAVSTGLDFSKVSVGELMNCNPLLLRDEYTVGEALAETEQQDRKVFSAPVIGTSGCCEGVITLHDFLR
jgi:arabinose-5-phosphate isomerase